MKRIIAGVILLLFHLPLSAQIDSAYQINIAKAGLFHLQKDVKNAIVYFERAFAIHPSDALNSYKAAGAYALNNNADRAFSYLELALDKGWTEADWLSLDPYFDGLRKAYPVKWKEIEGTAFEKEKEYARTLRQPELRKQINLMTLNDQMLRYKRIQASNSKARVSVDKEIELLDVNNYNNAVEIIKKYAWPKISDIGKDGQNNLWLVVQHADRDVRFQKLALSKMRKLLSTREATGSNYAFLYDRVQCNLNYKQLYGTQVVWTSGGTASAFRPIIKEHLVDKRRQKLGLEPLAIYSLSYGFSYLPVRQERAVMNDRSDLIRTKALIDSAIAFYRQKEFQKVYDYYNTASTIQGGMSNTENYKAALLFADIYNSTAENQYKGISLDFLYLLYLREALPLKKLEKEKVFRKFTGDARWIQITSRISSLPTHPS